MNDIIETPDTVAVSLDTKRLIGDLVGQVKTSERFRISKRHVAAFRRCEAAFVADYHSQFPGWTPAMARGSVVHEGIRIMLGATESIPVPKVADYALESSAQSMDGLGDWLRTADAAERADLRTRVVETLAKFRHDFPPIGKDKLIRPESKVEARIGTGTLVSKPDMVIGLPEVQGELIFSNSVAFEFKTSTIGMMGGQSELVFASLVECLRFGAPFARHVTWDATSGYFMTRDTTKEMILEAAEQLGREIARMEELIDGGAPGHTAGEWCLFCPISNDCEVGARFIEEAS